MRKKILLLSLMIGSFIGMTYAQTYCTGNRYKQPIFTTIDSTTSIVFGHPSDTLVMDVYYPASDTATNRPLIIFAHGGSFIGGDKSSMVPYCEYFASLGYVTATINYRLISVAAALGSGDLGKSFEEAALRATWDMRAAVRYFRRTVADSTNPFGINPNIIIVGGESAGGIMADLTTYVDQISEVPADVQSYATNNGGVDGTSGNPGYSSVPQLCISMCGAISDTNAIVAGNQPYVGIHTTQDPVVPNIYGQPNIGFSIPVDLYGDSSIYKRCQNVGVPSAYRSVVDSTHCGFDIDTAEHFITRFVYNQLCYNSLSVPVIVNNVNFSVYPNPANQQFYVDIAGKNFVGNISVYNIVGQEVYTQKIGSNQNRIAVNSSKFRPGIYLIRLISNSGEVAMKKVVIE